MSPVSSASTGEPWRVGVLFSRTGFMAIIEETQVRGTLIAIEEINEAGGINGREVVPVIYDPSSENALFRSHAKRMIVEDQLSTIFGCYTSSSRKAVLPIVERLNCLLWYPTLYEGFEYSPNVIYTGAAPNQNSLSLCEYLTGHYGSRFYFIGSDYVYPRESNRIMRELVNRRGGQVIGERYVGLRASRRDFVPIMNEIVRLSPDIIFSTVVGESTVHLYQAYADFGFDPGNMPIASLTTTEAEIRAMGAGVGEGHITAASYFESLPGATNSAFVRRYKRRFGNDQSTNMCVEAAYFQVHLFARALELANSLDPEILRPMVLGATFNAPQGRVSIDADCSHANLWSRIGRVNGRGHFDVVQESTCLVPPDPFLTGTGFGRLVPA
jgi:ABC-type branched-subunit amino acid transport system substrate-binding protein